MKKVLTVLVLFLIVATLLIFVSADDSELLIYESKAFQDGYIPSDYEATLFSTIDSETLKEIEGMLVEAWASMADTIDLRDTGITYEQFYNEVLPLYSHILNDHPEFFYVRGSAGYSQSIPYLGVIYNYDKADIPDMIDKFDAAVDEVISNIDAKNMSDIDIAFYLHDYLVLNAEYDEETYITNNTSNRDAFNAYGVLINNIGVCQSYTLAYDHLLAKFGIESTTVTSSELNHIWSLVKIGDGYYHVDVTHDDPITDRKGISKYTYFLCSDSELLADEAHGTVWASDYPAESDTFAQAFWKSTRSTMAYLDGTYYFAVMDDEYLYSLMSATSDNFTESTLLRTIPDTYWKVETLENRRYNSGQMYVVVFENNGNIYYNNSLNVFRYCPGYESDEIAFTYDSDFGFIRPLPHKSSDDLTFIFGQYNVENESLVFSHSEEMSGKLSGHSLISTVVPPTNTTYGYTVHTCETCDIEFKDTYVEPLKYLVGDVDGDGAVTSNDSVMLSRHFAKWTGYIELEYYFNADVNGDGKVDSTDSVVLSRHLAKWTGYLSLPISGESM